MTNSDTDALLSQLNKIICKYTGLFFPKERQQDIIRGVETASPELGFATTESCMRWLVSSPLNKNQVGILASHLTIGETYFFREKISLEIFEKQLLPELIRSRQEEGRRIKIWSAGCSTGEEPYSIAIMLSKALINIKEWNITILATDINPRFLRKAATGEYGEWSFRETPRLIKEKYFKKTDKERYVILPHLKENITFAYLNLAEDAYPTFFNNTDSVDFIFCRNVLMYFEPEKRRQTIERFQRSLVEGGWLIVSPGEASDILPGVLAPVNFNGVTFYRKSTRPLLNNNIPLSVKTDLFKSPDIDTGPGTNYASGNNIPTRAWLIDKNNEKARDAVDKQRTEQEPLKKSRENIYEQAKNLYAGGNYSGTAEILAQALSNSNNSATEPPPLEATILLIRTCANLGKFTEAMEYCSKQISCDKFNPGLRYLMATLLQEQGETDEAIVYLKRALYLNQNFVMAHFTMGNLMRSQGRPNESQKHYRIALDLLRRCEPEDILPESEGITAGNLTKIITVLTERKI